jgi:hypothetical protein
MRKWTSATAVQSQTSVRATHSDLIFLTPVLKTHVWFKASVKHFLTPLHLDNNWTSLKYPTCADGAIGWKMILFAGGVVSRQKERSQNGKQVESRLSRQIIQNFDRSPGGCLLRPVSELLSL